ncbi:hypothetical protein FB593_1237 [Rhizobium sp. SJZ105]|uniref:hypothetical protein n=1 Tax=Rhizobium sp. SJZ105 TaxID=2572678 RepID=UPI00119D35E6|nr:hypothetical protein [Rhizobium sp. SJZ105]TWC76334.1 hypothetical protein FB593_1237 [Rhizobium sp. SJZ105]
MRIDSDHLQTALDNALDLLRSEKQLGSSAGLSDIIEDSLDLMNILVAVEDEVGVSLNDDLIFELDLTSKEAFVRGLQSMVMSS